MTGHPCTTARCRRADIADVMPRTPLRGAARLQRARLGIAMLRYAIQRLLLMIPTLLGVAVLVFVLLRMLPGDIVELRVRWSTAARSAPEAIAAERVAPRARPAAVAAVRRLDGAASSSAISASRCGPASR